MHEISACKPRTVQPFLVAVLTFAVLVCRRFVHAFCRRFGMSPLTFAVLVCRRFDQAPADHVKSLGVTLQQDLSFDLHVIELLKQCS